LIGPHLTDAQIRRTLERYDCVDVELKGVEYGARVLITVIDPELGTVRLTVPDDILNDRGEVSDEPVAPKPLFARQETP